MTVDNIKRKLETEDMISYGPIRILGIILFCLRLVDHMRMEWKNQMALRMWMFVELL